MSDVSIEELKGKVLSSVVNTGTEVIFETLEGETYKLLHFQDCCESVRVEDVWGDLHDLVGSPITLAEESSRKAGLNESSESGTWTFYKFATRKGYVDIRWLGESNGYYGEGVDFIKV